VSLVRCHPGLIFPVERLEVAGMVFREVSVIEIREVLRAWLAGKSERAVAAQAGVDRKTSKRYVMAAVAAGLSRGGGEEQLTDELIGQVVSVVRPVRPDGHGQGWAELEGRREQITAWVKADVPVVKIGVLLARHGVVVAERTLHRFAAGRCGAGAATVTTPVDDGPPGGELQIDFGYPGLIPAGEGRRRKLHALVFTACFSRYMFAYLTFSMTLEEVIAGCEDAWAFFSGVFRVLVLENVARNIFRVMRPA
jgi:hypothetical protein